LAGQVHTFVKKFFPPKVDVFNPDHSFRVSDIHGWRMTQYLKKIPGVVFSPNRFRGRSDDLIAEFQFRGVAFRFVDGDDTGGDGLWIITADGLPHHVELRKLREHVQNSITRDLRETSDIGAQGIFGNFGRAFEWFEALEFAIPGLIAALLLFLGPPVASFYFFHKAHYFAGVFSAAIWLATGIAAFRDLRRRRLSWVTATLSIVWLITSALILLKLETF
jgi:hypothetical protein